MSKLKQGECFYPIFGTKNKNIEEGITNRNFSVWGTCLHKLFDNKVFCEEFIKYLKIRKELPYIEHAFTNREDKEKKYNRLAEIVRKNINIKAIYHLLNKKK
ncbi:hypothetical protein HY745_14005 [Candidatus Desantisbacteria bacterium]|nr:hypothetical protein [Candidatus Desantisbacteria bacterium]